MPKRIFTASFVAEQKPEYLAELLDRCFYDLVNAEATRIRDAREALERVAKLILAHHPKKNQPNKVCKCGRRKYRLAVRCWECYDLSRRHN
jgi:hypothetical protein